jgi:hypothetical protein
MGFAIFRHALTMVFRNLLDAFKVSLIPFGIAVVVTVFVTGTLIGSDLLTGHIDVQDAPLQLAVLSLLMVVVYMFLFSWVAVNWHRFILLEEYPRWFPEFRSRPIGPYIWHTIKAALLLMVCLIPIMLIGSFLASALGSLGAQLLVAIVTFAISYGWLRIAMGLAGTSIGQPIGLRASWAETAPLSGAIWGTAFCVMVMGMVATLFETIGGPVIGPFIGIVVNWITFIVGVSILTTLYGHTVQGRDLV